MHYDAETNTLVLAVDDPLGVRELIPRSRMVKHAQYNMTVQYTPVAAKVLKNLGVQAPSPLQLNYTWPGKYKPWAHQRVMAEVMTSHRRVFNLSDMGCVSADTEYLTPTGWQRIDQYTGGPVAQYWPETGRMEFVEAPEYVKLPCREMIQIKTQRGIDQLLSPEHRVLLQAYGNPRRQEVVSAETLLARHDQWIRREPTRRKVSEIAFAKSVIPAAFRTGGGAGIPLSDAHLRVQVAVIADGYFQRSSAWCVVRLKRERKKVRLRQLLTEAGIEHIDQPCAPDGFTVFKFYAPWRCKIFDVRFWSATAAQLQLIADEVMHWDGSFGKAGSGNRFSTKALASAEFVQYVFASTGRAARLTAQTREDGEVEYNVGVRGTEACTVGLASFDSHSTPREVMSRVASPDGFKYCFMVPSTFLVLRRNGQIFCTGNTGKSAATLWAADYLLQTQQVKKVLIVSPLSTLERVWMHDIFDILMHRTAVVVHGTREQRMKALATKADFYVLNHDGLSIASVAEAIRRNPDIGLVVIDEASKFRNADTKKYKALTKMLRPDMRLWLLTATPCPNNPTDAWALAKLVNPQRIPTFFGAFKRLTMAQLSTFKWIAKPDAYTHAFNAMQPAVRFEKSQCLDLPPVTYKDRQATITPEQREAYEQMRMHMQAEAADTEITAVNAADKLTKIRQILCGAIKDPVTGAYHVIPHGPRLEALLDVIAEAHAKVIVVVPFKGIIQELAKEVGAHYSVAVMNGDVSITQRNKIVQAFKTGADPRVLLCHPEVMSHGLNLSEADVTVFYAPIYSNDQFQQVMERMNRAGQKNKMTVVKIAAMPMEWAIYAALDGSQKQQMSTLDLYRMVTS